MDNTWELITVVEKSVDNAFSGRFTLDMYQYLKSINASKRDAREFLESETAKNINLTIYDLEDYIEGGNDEMHKQLREAYGYLGKPEARKVKNFLEGMIVGASKYEYDKRPGRRRKPSK